MVYAAAPVLQLLYSISRRIETILLSAVLQNSRARLTAPIGNHSQLDTTGRSQNLWKSSVRSFIRLRYGHHT